MNSIAGIARMFELIDHHYDDYSELQRKIVENSQVGPGGRVSPDYLLTLLEREGVCHGV